MRALEINGNLVMVGTLGASQNLATGAASAVSNPVGRATRIARLCVDVACRVVIGPAPTALATSALLPALVPACFQVNALQEPLRCRVNVTSNVVDFFRSADIGFINSRGGLPVSLVTGQTVYFVPEPGATLPAPLAVDTPYYVRADGAVSAGIAGLAPGAAVDITDAGTGGFLAYTADRIAAIQNAAPGSLNIVELGN